MPYNPEAVAEVVSLNGGELVGNTRLQKTVYFLERLGIGFGFNFTYYYYGPFSDELKTSASDAAALEMLNLVERQTTSGNSFYTYQLTTDVAKVDSEFSKKRSEVLNILRKFDSISIELAATADYLRSNGYGDNFWDETKSRKNLKFTPSYESEAKDLLREIDNIAAKI